MAQVLIIGGASLNLLIHLHAFPAPQPQTLYARDFHEAIGSTGVGKALNLRKLGFAVTLHAPIGDDVYGRAIIGAMANANVQFLYDIDPSGTQRHVNLMDAQGRRMSIFLLSGSVDLLFDQARLEQFIPSSDYVLLNITNYCRTLIPAIKRNSKAIWCDLHDYDGVNPYYDDFIAAADYLFLSSQALPGYRAFMQQMIAQGKQLVVCTHGEYGSTALAAAGEWIETPIISSYQLRDSNGAGDAFVAGVLYGHDLGYSVAQCLRLGTVVSGLCIADTALAASDLSRALVDSEYQRAYGEALGPAKAG